MSDKIIEVDQELALVVNQAGLAEEKSKQLIANFGKYFAESREIVKVAKTIKVTDISQKEEMAKAREIRLQLQHIRTKGVEPLRVSLKEQSLREGKAIDGMANVIKALIMPVEEYLASQEKFAERIEAERKNNIEAERIAELGKYVENIEVYTLHPDKLSQESFDQLLKTSKIAFEAQKKANEEAEKARIEQEQKQKLFTERRIELAPYSQFLEGNFELNVETTETEYNRVLEAVKQLKKTYDEEQKAIRIQAEKDRQAREKAELELKKQQEAIAEQKRQEELKKKADEEAAKKALQAPDKEKLLKTATDLSVFQFPILDSEEAKLIKHDAIMALSRVVDLIRERASKL